MSPTTPRLLTLIAVLAAGAVLGLQGLHAPRVPAVALGGSGVKGQGPTTTGAAPSAKGAGASSSGTAASSNGASGSTSSAATSGSAASGGHGTLLSSTQVAPYTYEVYPSPSAQLTQAEAGFTVSVHSAQGGAKTFTVSNASGGALVNRPFLSSDRVYWVETSYGDDAPGQDANFGDDAYIMTNAQGYITKN